MSTHDTVGILGMHRSGTSCLTGCLGECGLYLGDVVTSNWDNLMGNRENLAIRSLNDDVLKYSGGKWNVPPNELTWTNAHRQERERIAAAFADHECWGFKDPRTLLTLPFWLDGFPHMRLVGTFRHPGAVARSLGQRDRIPEQKVMSLWAAYNAELLKAHERFGCSLICFDWPQQQYLDRVGEMARNLGLRDATGTASLSFFDATLRTKNGSAAEIEIPSTCLKLHETLLHAAN